MNSTKIQKNITTFEQYLSNARWNWIGLIIIYPFGVGCLYIPVLFICFIVSILLRIDFIHNGVPVNIAIVLAALYFLYWEGKHLNKIRKDLIAKSYIPISATVKQLYFDTHSSGGITYHHYYAQLHTICLSTRTTSKLPQVQNDITIKIQKETYKQLKQEDTLFIIVGKHTNY